MHYKILSCNLSNKANIIRNLLVIILLLPLLARCNELFPSQYQKARERFMQYTCTDAENCKKAQDYLKSEQFAREIRFGRELPDLIRDFKRGNHDAHQAMLIIREEFVASQNKLRDAMRHNAQVFNDGLDIQNNAKSLLNINFIAVPLILAFPPAEPIFRAIPITCLSIMGMCGLAKQQSAKEYRILEKADIEMEKIKDYFLLVLGLKNIKKAQ